jgi:serine/threonine protein phosphatase 1
MSFWRPAKNCTYVISDINGMNNELELILSRILPLRKTGGSIDKLIFLGNYICGKSELVDLIIKEKAKCPDQIICLMGDNDLRLLKSIDYFGPADATEYSKWLSSGGSQALIGYLQRIKSDNTNPYLITRQYLKRFIPQTHLDFISSLLPYYETEDYIFVHGGCDPNIPLDNQKIDVLVNDRSIFNLVSKSGKCPWKKMMITGGVGKLDGKPLIKDKFITLDGSYAERLYVLELNSRQIFSARKGKSRLVKEYLDDIRT